ncbi:hypothetical protein [Arthrobacter globiformis]|uniref:hypothetical protein n=1 Tax=Arthrobacter globiformis TaxID=1665 RepID=UPI0027843238|nr:hypothetical protein [Arthrobacter globiformis]
MGSQRLPVRVPAVPADELHRVPQAGEPDGDVERAAAHMGFDSGAALDHVNEALADNSEHGHTLPENAARRSGSPQPARRLLN